jgi:two-component system cell cycle response regulator DivK
MRVLYVEDDELNFRLVERVLTHDGHEVVRARDGGTGLHLATKLCPDIVLMDLLLPDVSGFETARRIRQVPSLAGVPIVAVTGMWCNGERERALAEGFAGFVAKPFRIDTLREALLQATAGRSGVVAAGTG